MTEIRATRDLRALGQGCDFLVSDKEPTRVLLSSAGGRGVASRERVEPRNLTGAQEGDKSGV